MLLSDSWIVSIESPFYNLHTARSMKIFTFKENKRKKRGRTGAEPTHLPGGTQSRRSVSHLFPVYQKWLVVLSRPGGRPQRGFIFFTEFQRVEICSQLIGRTRSTANARLINRWLNLFFLKSGKHVTVWIVPFILPKWKTIEWKCRLPWLKSNILNISWLMWTGLLSKRAWIIFKIII